jgi:hypothetical protein
MSEQRFDLEKKIFPDNGKLTKDKDGVWRTNIITLELEIFKCLFIYDDCVTIELGNHKHLKLTKKHLKMLSSLIDKTDKLYGDEFE